jgi:hypothetical protein
MQRFSNDCNALFGAVGARRNSVPLMEFEPAIEKFLLIWDLGYVCLRDFEWRLGGSEAIGPEF